MVEIKRFESRAELAIALADGIASAITEALGARSRASLVVPGGSSPQACFAELATRELAWAQVDVLLSDERWVDDRDEASNQKMLGESLFVGHAAAANAVLLKGDEASPEEGVAAAVARVSSLSQPFDVALLGMGTDGHTASLFPDMPNIAEGLADAAALCVPARPPSQPTARLSLSAEALGNASNLWVLITGDEKLDVLERGMVASAPPPIASVLTRHSAPVVWWAP